MYYPLSQISSNLYTNGEEFVYLSTKQPYVGYYWKNSKGKYYTGKTPQDTPTEEIVPTVISSQTSITPPNIENNFSYYNQDGISLEYIESTNPEPPSLLPTYSLTLPTQQDYVNGEMRRYFCKKTNEIIYLEVSKDTYDKLAKKDPQILYQLYRPFNLPWQLTGNKEQVYKTNRNITELISTQGKFPMLMEYLKMDFTKYYK
jgi:hypothetical protein